MSGEYPIWDSSGYKFVDTKTNASGRHSSAKYSSCELKAHVFFPKVKVAPQSIVAADGTPFPLPANLKQRIDDLERWAKAIRKRRG